MKTMYLKDGRMVDVVSEDVNGKVLVAPYIEIHESYGSDPDNYTEVYDEVVGKNMIFVDKSDLTEKVPVEVYDKKILSLKDDQKSIEKNISEKKNELSRLEYSIKNAQQTAINNEKFIINKSELINATSIALFAERDIMPMLTEKSQFRYGGFRGLKISMEIKFNGEERSWGYKIYHEEGHSSGEFLCKTHGIIINPTPEQLDEIIKERLKKLDINDSTLLYRLRGVPEEFISPEMIAKRNEKRIQEVKNDIEKKKREQSGATDYIKAKMEELALLEQ